MARESLQRILQWAQGECERQHVGPERQLLLLRAYQEAWELSESHRVPTLAHCLRLAQVLEPESRGRVRSTPVTFASGGSAAAPDAAGEALASLFAHLPSLADALDEALVDAIVRSFESIHPFVDGNGRMAALLRVWLLQQWEAPESLPFYRHY